MGPFIVAVRNLRNTQKKLLVTHINWSHNLHRTDKSAVYPTVYVYQYVAARDADRAPTDATPRGEGGGGEY